MREVIGARPDRVIACLQAEGRIAKASAIANASHFRDSRSCARSVRNDIPGEEQDWVDDRFDTGRWKWALSMIG
jgi:hypothetical protein